MGPMRLAAAFLTVTAAAWAGDTLLVLHKLDDSLGYYDAATGQMSAKVKTGRKPHEFALSADERFAYVTNYGADTFDGDEPGGNSITVIDVRARSAVGEIVLAGHRRPHGIERGKSGLFYVTTDSPAALLVIDGAKRRVVRAIGIDGKRPHMVQLTRDERQAWTADALSGTVTVVDLQNRRVRGRIETGGVPMGFALSADERTLFVATRSNNRVVVVDAVVNRVRRNVGLAGMPSRLGLSGDGRSLYVSLIESGEVAAVNTRTYLETARVKAGGRAEGLRVDAEGGALYVSAQAENKVIRFALPSLEKTLEIGTEAKPDPIYLLRGPAR